MELGDGVRAARRAALLERFERQTALPMLLLSLAIIPVVLIPLTVDLSGTQVVGIETVGWIIWAAFAVEYSIRLYLSPDRAHFFRHHLLDLAFVLLPFLRPLRLVRSLRVFRAARAAVVLARGVEAARDVLTRHKLHYALLVATLAVIGGAFIVETFERAAPAGSNPTIHTVGDALWWSVVTVTSVGYGDKYPVTAGGRGVAVVLMLLGVGLYGLLAASLASFFIGEREEQQEDELRVRLDRMEAMLSQLVDRSEEREDR